MFLVENVLNLVVRLGNLWVILDVFEDTMGYGNDSILCRAPHDIDHAEFRGMRSS